jgi:hypothetical protein
MVNWEKLYKKLSKLWADSRSYPRRLLLSGAVMLAFSFTFLFYGPLDLVAFNGSSLPYTYHDVIWLLVGLFLGLWVLSAPLIALLRGRIFNYTLCVLSSLVAGGYLQALLFNGNLGLLTGDSISWTLHRADALLGLGVWAIVLVFFLFISYMHRRFFEKLILFVSCLLVVMQLTPTVAILCGAYDQAKPDHISGYHLSTEGYTDFSSDKNVFVFVLDRLDYKYIEQALALDPHFLDGLDGFTCYDNAISGYARTKPALIHMLTGSEEKTFRVSAEQYYKEAWTDGSNLLEALQQQNFTIEMYSNVRNLFSDPQFASRYVANFSNGTDGMNYDVVAKKLLELSAFRYAPTALKPFYFADTNYYHEGVYRPDTNPIYEFDDFTHYRQLQKATATKDTPSFKFYHFYGTHAAISKDQPAYTMKADGTINPEGTNVQEQAIGSFVNLIRIFDRMKELGIYKNATIIITGDHGSAISDTKPLQAATRIGLFYKPAGSAGTPLKHSSAPVSVTNIPATLVKAAGGDYTAFGAPLDEVAENADIIRYYYITVCAPEPYRETLLYIYAVTGDASDIQNWVHVETVEIPYSYN